MPKSAFKLAGQRNMSAKQVCDDQERISRNGVQSMHACSFAIRPCKKKSFIFTIIAIVFFFSSSAFHKVEANRTFVLPNVKGKADLRTRLIEVFQSADTHGVPNGKLDIREVRRGKEKKCRSHSV